MINPLNISIFPIKKHWFLYNYFSYLLFDSKKHEENKMIVEDEATDYYILAEYEPQTHKKPTENTIPTVEIDLNLIKPYHYDNVVDEFNNFIDEKNEDSPRNEDSI